MFDLIEIELTRVRRMAEQTNDDFLLYLIDMAIIAANARARSGAVTVETANPGPLERDEQRFTQRHAPDFHVVS